MGNSIIDENSSLLEVLNASRLTKHVEKFQSLGILHAEDLLTLLMDETEFHKMAPLWKVKLKAIPYFAPAFECSHANNAIAGNNEHVSFPPKIISKPNGDLEYCPLSSGPTIVVTTGKIQKCSTDIIVNAANSRLQHVGGMAKDILDAGGSIIEEESDAWIKKNGFLKEGQIAVTSGGDLKAKSIIHAVGPCVGRNKFPNQSQIGKLRSCIRKSLATAEEMNASSISIPAISTGIFNFPKPLGATISIDEVERFCLSDKVTSLKKIVMINNDEYTTKLYKDTLRNLHSPDKDENRDSVWRSISTSTVPSPRRNSLKEYKAAGVLPVRRSESESGTMEILLGIERRIVGACEEKNLKDDLQNELKVVKRLKELPQHKLVELVAGADWRLKLKAPQKIPESPIMLLSPNGNEFKSICDLFDVNSRENIVSIRKCMSSIRKTSYQQAIAMETGTEMVPLFHGTPECWRATAIAIKGFDLSISLCGRSLGDGVYTSSDINVALQYYNKTGSILHMKGFVAPKKTVTSQNVYVFPNSKHVLPNFIIDFSESDEKDKKEDPSQHYEEEMRLRKQRIKDMTNQIKEKETKASEFLLHHMKTSLDIYEAKLNKWMAALNESTILEGESDSSCSFAEDYGRRFRIEKKQFEARLPIYLHKEKLVTSFKTCSVVIVMSDTGSGKSTQLPQFILDDVISKDDNRRVAVLQPRRVNAISLSKRVAVERLSVPGAEVGYSLGRGETNCTKKLE